MQSEASTVVACFRVSRSRVGIWGLRLRMHYCVAFRVRPSPCFRPRAAIYEIVCFPTRKVEPIIRGIDFYPVYKQIVKSPKVKSQGTLGRFSGGVQGVGCRVKGVGCRVWSVGCEAESAGCRGVG